MRSQWLTLSTLSSFEEPKLCVYNVYDFSAHKGCRSLKLILEEKKKEPAFPVEQYHDCWWPDNIGSQGISSYSTDLVLLV